jgi:hypothetical protein
MQIRGVRSATNAALIRNRQVINYFNTMDISVIDIDQKISYLRFPVLVRHFIMAERYAESFSANSIT